MSEAKAQGKVSAGSKKPKVEKAETGKKEAIETPKSAETTSVEKTDAAPKSASQSSISHFSNVSTPAYKEGWESIFGGSKVDRKKAPDTASDEHFPEKMTIHDDDIDKELRGALYKAFQRKARKQGISLAKIKKLADFEYSLECDITEK